MKVLVADDNVDLAQTLAVLLELHGHTVQVAFDGAAALRTAAEFLPEACICDIGMPVLDGYAVARALRTSKETSARPLLIACTGYGNAFDVRDAFAAGFDHHLTKPPVIADLLRLLALPAAAGIRTC